MYRPSRSGIDNRESTEQWASIADVACLDMLHCKSTIGSYKNDIVGLLSSISFLMVSTAVVAKWSSKADGSDYVLKKQGPDCGIEEKSGHSKILVWKSGQYILQGGAYKRMSAWTLWCRHYNCRR